MWQVMACVLVMGMCAVVRAEGPACVLELPPGAGNPRNSEGSFVTLKDGRVMFVYTHFMAGTGSDHDASHLAARFSSDGGATWTSSDVKVLENEGKLNTMSVSLLRLSDGRIGLWYLRKNSMEDCRPYVRFSSDEAKTWGEPVEMIGDGEVGYYVLNNDRVVQLKSGRLVAPVALHDQLVNGKFNGRGTVFCYLSDDGGRTWRRSKSRHDGTQADGKRLVLQEPGVVELKDGRVMMFIRASGGAQQVSYSSDGGETWTVPVRSSLESPLSPASIKRLPGGELLAVWNNHAGMEAKDPLYNRRTPLTAAVSRDEGATWTQVKNIAGDPDGWYCYTAIHVVGDAVLLGHCAGMRSTGGLSRTQVTRVAVGWLIAGS